MEDNAQSVEKQNDELSADVLQFTEMFKPLSQEAKVAMLELLRQLNDKD